MQTILEIIQQDNGDAVLETHEYRGDWVVIAKADRILEFMRFLKTNEALLFDVLMDLAAVDYAGQNREPRFDVVYHLYSNRHNHRLRVKVSVDDGDPEVPSLVPLWAAANWYEREVWDMFGIRFRGHPNLKRILLYEEFKGHPLRKDYPVNKRHPLIGPKN